MVCESCLKGYDGTNDNGYQPCSCDVGKESEPPSDKVTTTEDLTLLKEQLTYIKQEIYFAKENLSIVRPDEDNYHLIISQIDRLDMVLKWLGGTEEYE